MTLCGFPYVAEADIAVAYTIKYAECRVRVLTKPGFTSIGE